MTKTKKGIRVINLHDDLRVFNWLTYQCGSEDGMFTFWQFKPRRVNGLWDVRSPEDDSVVVSITKQAFCTLFIQHYDLITKNGNNNNIWKLHNPKCLTKYFTKFM